MHQYEVGCHMQQEALPRRQTFLKRELRRHVASALLCALRWWNIGKYRESVQLIVFPLFLMLNAIAGPKPVVADLFQLDARQSLM